MELSRPNTTALVRPDFQASDPESILRYAIDQKADVAVIERLMVVREKLEKEKAKKMYDASMAAFQAECPPIVKSKEGAQGKYRYAPLDVIIAQVKELIQRHGFSYSITSDIEKDWVKAICRVTHFGGHSEVSEFKVPTDPRATLMSAPQQYGASMTFAKRYAFVNSFGIMTADEDNDGGPKTKPKPPEDRRAEPVYDDAANKRKLVDLLRNIHGVSKGYEMDERAKNAITSYLIDEVLISDTQTVSDLAGKPLADVVEKVRRKLQGR